MQDYTLSMDRLAYRVKGLKMAASVLHCGAHPDDEDARDGQHGRQRDLALHDPRHDDVGFDHVYGDAQQNHGEDFDPVPRPDHERAALLVFIKTGCLADQHEAGVRVALARHRTRVAATQLALAAAGDLFVDLTKLGNGGDSGHLAAPARRAGDAPL